MNSQAVRFGANYVPSRNWWYSWVDWDRASIADDLAALAALGLDHIRIHCLWPIFQPNAALVSSAALDRLSELLDLADAANLDVQVTVLDGWLSGFVFIPPWVGRRNIFTDPAVIDAETLLIQAIARRVGGHRRFMGFDLGNELGVLLSQGHPATQAECDAWQTRLCDACETAAPGKFHVNGVDHVHWFSDVGFTRDALAREGSATSVHAWIEFTGFAKRYGAQSVASLHLPEYCIELAKAYHVDPDRLVWLQEFGASEQWMPRENIPDFAEKTIRHALSSSHVWGVTWWCSHDVAPSLKDFHPLEYDLGLLDTANRAKPVGMRVKDLIASVRRDPPVARVRSLAIAVPDDAFSEARARPFYEHWVERIEEGIGPALVLASRAGDAAYLASRGIERVVNV